MEMSEKTADPNFILRKKIEKKFSDIHPELWTPLYSRVTFSNKPYSEALNIGDQQAAIMDQVMSRDNIQDNWDSEEVMQLIKSLATTKFKS